MLKKVFTTIQFHMFYNSNNNNIIKPTAYTGPKKISNIWTCYGNNPSMSEETPLWKMITYQIMSVV